MNKTIPILLSILILLACTGMRAKDEAEVMLSPANPDKVPESVELYKSRRVLVLTFEATEMGYTLLERTETLGSPSQSIDLNRDVLVTARDASGDVVGQVSVYNPRQIHTAGSEKPERAVLDKGYFTVSFPDPDQIKTITIEVRRGPNARLKETYKV